MNMNSLTKIEAFKLFEIDALKLPKSLVHGRPFYNTGKRTRSYPLDTWIVSERGTPGFNIFLTESFAISYLPRFKVRYPRLRLCKIMIYEDEIITKENSNYHLVPRMMIESTAWQLAKSGKELI